ncbi:hypothetical protein M3Y14_33970 (plasmid) [Bacillus thuringiensis]|uniref:hypothetical protein n=1 Tax=Bacillus thuringiensis TaxID=1428 RepID=UPI002225B53E|nr:hypothetical protein [Bacillus thuringiensis]UYX56256.1 hypothetical protein M3Y14_33970 [Bacillus thuringiensis]
MYLSVIKLESLIQPFHGFAKLSYCPTTTSFTIYVSIVDCSKENDVVHYNEHSISDIHSIWLHFESAIHRACFQANMYYDHACLQRDKKQDVYILKQIVDTYLKVS